MAQTPTAAATATPVGVSRLALSPRLLQALAVLAVVVATGAPLAVAKAADAALPLGPDQGLYVTIGELIARGGVPWRDAWENKPPGTYYLYAAVLAVAPDYSRPCTFSGWPFGRDGFRPSCAGLALGAVDWLYALATAAAVWWLGRRLFGPAGGAVAAVLFGLFASMAQVAHGGSNPDVHALLPSALACAAAVRFVEARRLRWLVLAGALGAGATLFKQTGLATLLALGAWSLLDALQDGGRPARRACLRRWGALALGTGLLLVPTAIVFGLLGALVDLVDQSLLWYRFYLAAPSGGGNVAYLALNQSWKVFSQSQAGLWLAALGAVPLLPAGLRQDRRVGVVLAWAVGSAASVALAGAHFHQYYYVALVPGSAVLGGWSLTRLWRAAPPPARVWLAATAAGVLLLASQLQAQVLLRAWNDRITSSTLTPEEFVAGLAREGPPGSLLVWGNGSQVYALSGRPPASRYLHTPAVSQDFARTDDWASHRAGLLEDLRRQPPIFIAVDGAWLRERGTAPFAELEALIASSYAPVNDPANPIYQGWRLFRRQAAA